MSSTHRSAARSAHVYDYYVTPIDEVVKFLRAFLAVEPCALSGRVLDCCAGGRIGHEPMSYPEAMIQCGIDEKRITTLDIRADSRAQIIADYLTHPTESYDSIITNPPFDIALQIIQKAISDASPNGWVIVLLRLNFLEGKLRKSFWDQSMPKYIFVHHKRLSFTGKGTDSVAYAHFVFHRPYKENYSKTFVI